MFQRVSEAGPQLLDRSMVAVNNLNDLLNEQNRKAVSDSLQNMRTVTEALVAPSQEVRELVANANATVVEMTKLVDHIDQGFSGKSGLKDQASQALGDFDRLARNLIDTNRQLQQVIQENRPALRDFTAGTLIQEGNLVSDMQRSVDALSRFLTSVERDPARLLFGERREGYRPR